MGDKEGTSVEKRLPRLRRPTLPSAEPMKQKVSKLRDEITKRSERIAEIKGMQDRFRGQARGGEGQGLSNELSNVRGEFVKLLNQKKAMREQLQQIDQTRNQIRESAKQSKEKLQYTSVEEIDKQMKALETKLNTEDVGGIKEEKRIIEQIRKLNQSKQFVIAYSQKIEQLDKGKDTRDEITQRLDKLNAELDTLSAREKSIKKQLDEQRNQRGKQSEDMDKLNAEKQECYEVIKASRERISELQQDYNVQFDKFKLDMEEFKKQAAERDAQYQAEREARDVERKKKEEELVGAPFSEHVLRCEQLICYLSKYVTTEDKDKDKDKNSVTQQPASSPGLEGMQIVRKKGEEEDDPLAGTLTRTKAGGGKKGKKGSRGSNSASGGGTGKKMLLDMDLITAFRLIDVRTPAGVEEAADILKEVKEKQLEYKTKQEEAKKGENVKMVDKEQDNEESKQQEDPQEPTSEVNEEVSSEKLDEEETENEAKTEVKQDEVMTETKQDEEKTEVKQEEDNQDNDLQDDTKVEETNNDVQVTDENNDDDNDNKADEDDKAGVDEKE
eukprot:TRINITY_DN632_c0_g1_i3.p1 TRINITY_DN632_c0_g1~~TRINITY_DN632_c0_g1_i3.p1  ORF type:complete len:556 (-),score=134.69 TRINITY_DN632_c0_g1_i3:360-2027(-)